MINNYRNIERHERKIGEKKKSKPSSRRRFSPPEGRSHSGREERDCTESKQHNNRKHNELRKIAGSQTGGLILKNKNEKVTITGLRSCLITQQQKKKTMRVYKKRTNRESVPQEVMKTAICLVLKNRDKKGFSIRSVARMHNINYTTLSRYVKKCRRTTCAEEDVETSDSNEDLTLEWKKIPGQVFNRDHEAVLIDYINLCSRVNCALRPKHARYLAYQYATKFDLNHPSSWDKNKKAGEDWLTSFLRRNESELPFSSQAMRSRAASFNKADAKKFYDRLKELYDRHEFKASNIYNMSVSSVSTIVTSGRSIAARRAIVKRSEDCQEAPEKNGETVSLAAAVNAVGRLVPPMIIFPRKKYHHRFVQDGPDDCVGAGNASGSMTDDTFIAFVKHFAKHAKPSETNPVLLIMDNGSATHLSVPLLDLCGREALTLLSLPPHCTQKLQPLDVAVNRAFKEYCKISMDDWLKRYLGKRMTVHDLPSIIKEPLLGAMIPSNITMGFARTGIYPLRFQNFEEGQNIVEPHFLTGGEFEDQPPTNVANNLPMEYPDFGHLM